MGCAGETRDIWGYGLNRCFWGDGFLLLYKHLDNGCPRLPRNESEARLLTAQEVRWFFEGLEIEQLKAIKPRRKGIVYRMYME